MTQLFPTTLTDTELVSIVVELLVIPMGQILFESEMVAVLALAGVNDCDSDGVTSIARPNTNVNGRAILLLLLVQFMPQFSHPSPDKDD